MNLSRAALLIAALTGSAAALETELQSGGFSIGADKKPAMAYFSSELQNKAMRHGIVTNSDANLRTSGGGRFYGFGAHLAWDMAIGEDKNAAYLESSDPTTYKPVKIKPFEATAVNTRLDFLLDIGGVYEQENAPFLQVIPYFQVDTTPYTGESVLKTDQKWLGLDLWMALPFEGVEIGTGHEWNIDEYAYRGAIGFREFYQSGNLDLAFSQVFNFGDSNAHNLVTGSNHRGFTTLDLGAKGMVPTIWREWWFTAGANWTYWIDGDDRDALSSGVGYHGPTGYAGDAGDLQFSVGMEWRAEGL